MKSIIVYCNLVLVVFLISCNKQTTESKEVRNSWTPQPILLADIYSKSTIDNYLFNLEESEAKDSVINESKKLFLLGIDALKNKKDYKKAIDLTLKSLTLYPEAKAYYELGNALVAINQYAEAISAYEEAVEFDFNPKAQLYYQLAYCKAKKDGAKHYDVKNYINLAIKNGLLHQPNFSINSLELFKGESWYASITSELNGQESQEKLFFQSFVEGFNPAPVGGFELKPEEVEMTNQNKQFISYEYKTYIKEMENVSFGRDVSHEFFYLSQVHHTDDYIALVYGSEEISYGGMANIAYYMVTFTKEGKEIDKQLVGCNCSAEKVKAFTIKKNKVLVTQLTRVWEKDLKEVPTSENKIKAYVEENKQNFVINDKGLIEDSNSSLGQL